MKAVGGKIDYGFCEFFVAFPESPTIPYRRFSTLSDLQDVRKPQYFQLTTCWNRENSLYLDCIISVVAKILSGKKPPIGVLKVRVYFPVVGSRVPLWFLQCDEGCVLHSSRASTSCIPTLIAMETPHSLSSWGKRYVITILSFYTGLFSYQKWEKNKPIRYSSHCGGWKKVFLGSLRHFLKCCNKTSLFITCGAI